MSGVGGLSRIMEQEFRLKWLAGKVGKESAAARYGSATPTDNFSIQEDKPYAEVRMKI